MQSLPVFDIQLNIMLGATSLQEAAGPGRHRPAVRTTRALIQGPDLLKDRARLASIL
jgi:hypothetical protein